MLEQLKMLFGRAMDGKIEITAIRASTEKTRPRFRYFDVDDLESAAEWAAEINSEHMWNVYVGAALRRDDTFPGEVANDGDFLRTYAVWADADDEAQLNGAKAAYRAAGLPPATVVVTGRTPERRAQMWWPLETPITDIDVLRATLRGIADALGTDHGVLTGKQLMRLAGSLAWPKPNKAGRVLEVTELLRISGAQGEVHLEQLHRAFPIAERKPAERAHEAGSTLAGALAEPDLRSALAAIPADDRDVWIRMGHALKPLGDQGLNIWIDWSQTSDKYDDEDALRVWDSFKPQRTGYQAVFAEAQRRGWENPASKREAPAYAFDPETGEVIDIEEPTEPSRPIRASEFVGEPPEREWIIPEWIVKGAVNSLYGDGGLGKTLLAQQLACACAIGGKWLGMDAARGSVLAVLCEDEKDELHRRHNAIKAALGYVVGNPFEDVWLWPRVGDENVLIRWDKDDKPTLGAFMADLVREVEEINPSLLILDTLADFYAGNEISRPHVNYFVKTVLGGLIKRQKEKGHGLTVLLLGHPSVAGKASGSGYSGSTAWNAAVRARMYLARPEDGAADERILTRGKANYAKSGDETAVRLFYADGVLHACDDVQDGDAILWAAKEEVCRLVERAWHGGQPYSAQKGHKRHIYAALPQDLQRSGYQPQIARQAIRDAIDDGLIGPGRDNSKRGYRAVSSGR